MSAEIVCKLKTKGAVMQIHDYEAISKKMAAGQGKQAVIICGTKFPLQPAILKRERLK